MTGWVKALLYDPYNIILTAQAPVHAGVVATSSLTKVLERERNLHRCNRKLHIDFMLDFFL
jgi:hypothetical protein